MDRPARRLTDNKGITKFHHSSFYLNKRLNTLSHHTVRSVIATNHINSRDVPSSETFVAMLTYQLEPTFGLSSLDVVGQES